MKEPCISTKAQKAYQISREEAKTQARLHHEQQQSSLKERFEKKQQKKKRKHRGR